SGVSRVGRCGGVLPPLSRAWVKKSHHNCNSCLSILRSPSSSAIGTCKKSPLAPSLARSLTHSLSHSLTRHPSSWGHKITTTPSPNRLLPNQQSKTSMRDSTPPLIICTSEEIRSSASSPHHLNPTSTISHFFSTSYTHLMPPHFGIPLTPFSSLLIHFSPIPSNTFTHTPHLPYGTTASRHSSTRTYYYCIFSVASLPAVTCTCPLLMCLPWRHRVPHSLHVDDCDSSGDGDGDGDGDGYSDESFGARWRCGVHATNKLEGEIVVR
ncbi:unnamed protein product, partial [Hymenolepis diminuta]